MLSDGTNTTMLVTPNNGGMGFDGGGWWMILFIVLLFANGFNGGANNIPFAMNTGNEVQRGFDQAAIVSGVNGIQTSINGISSQICNGFSQAEIGNNARQMADMNQMFALQSQMASCCCENRLATNDLKYTIAQEACANRTAATANTQAILDKLCQIEMDTLKTQLDAKNDIIASLQNQLNMATLNASQVAQTAQIISELKTTTAA